MFLPIQLAAAKALTLGKNWHEQINSVYGRRREKVFQLLDALSCNIPGDRRVICLGRN
jgi:hypothetical protein